MGLTEQGHVKDDSFDAQFMIRNTKILVFANDQLDALF
jgi:hypothetical protein